MSMSTLLRERRAAGPIGRPLVGCLGAFRRDPLGLLQHAAQRHGDLVRLRIGPVLVHLINRPDYIQHVLVEQHRRYDKRTRSVAKMRATCGKSLLTTDGDEWLRLRRIVQPIFQAQRLEAFLPVIREAIVERMSVWQAAARGGQPLELVSEMLHLTLQVAARVLFGADVRHDAELIERSLEIILDDTWRRLETLFDLSSVSPVFHKSRYRDAMQNIDRVVQRLLAERRQHGPQDDLLSVLLAARDEQTGMALDDRQLRDAAVTLLLAGHETTANALTWTFSLLAAHPSAERQLRHEVDRALSQKHSDNVNPSQLRYADQVFAEAIRLYPSIWIMERRAVVDDRIDGIRIPAGSTILISPFTLHRHPDLWPAPEDFDPHRFAPERSRQRPRFAYIPFGAGPHVCIGQAMAQLVARLTLALAYQQFRFTPVQQEPPAVKPGITLRHARPILMHVAIRQRSGNSQ